MHISTEKPHYQLRNGVPASRDTTISILCHGYFKYLFRPQQLIKLYRKCIFNIFHEELYGAAVSALRRAIAEVKQRWSVTHQPALGPLDGLWPVLLMCYP
jgi:hypothetical protein